MQVAMWILWGTVLGAGCGWTALLWAGQMLRTRGRKEQVLSWVQVVLVISAAVWGGVIGFYTDGWLAMVSALAVLTVGIAVVVSDGLCRIIPNPAVLALFGVKLLLMGASLLNIPGAPPVRLLSSLGGMVACFLIFWAPGLVGKQVGPGDIKLAAAMGFLLGFSGALFAVVIMGALVLGYSVLQRKMPLLLFLQTNIPMGPFIAAGMMIAYMVACISS